MDTVFGHVKVRRGSSAGIPTLAFGEPYFADDTGNLWVGSTLGNVKVSKDDTGAAALAAHIANTIAAHAASAIAVTPTGDVAATNVQAAIAELATEKATTGSVSIVAAAAAGNAADIAAHLADTTAAHAASAIAFSGGTTFSSTTVQDVLTELDNKKADLDFARRLALLDL